MKHSKLAAAVATVALFFAGVAVSAEANKMTVRIDQKVTVDGKILETGKYTAEWNGDGPNVQVTLLHGKDTVATFPAQIKQEASPNTHRCNRHHRRPRRLEATHLDLSQRQAHLASSSTTTAPAHPAHRPRVRFLVSNQRAFTFSIAVILWRKQDAPACPAHGVTSTQRPFLRTVSVKKWALSSRNRVN